MGTQILRCAQDDIALVHHARTNDAYTNINTFTSETLPAQEGNDIRTFSHTCYNFGQTYVPF